MVNKLSKLAALEKLSTWEKTFIADLIQRKTDRGADFTLSEKQTAILVKIEKERSTL